MIVTPTGRILSGLQGLGTAFTPLTYTPVPVPPLPPLDNNGIPIGMDFSTAGNITLQREQVLAGNRAAQAAVDTYNGQMNTFLANGGPSNPYGYKAPALPDVQAIYQAAAAGVQTGSFTSTPRVNVPVTSAPAPATGGTVTQSVLPMSTNAQPVAQTSTNAQATTNGATTGGPTDTGSDVSAPVGVSGLEIIIGLVGLGLTFLMFSKGSKN